MLFKKVVFLFYFLLIIINNITCQNLVANGSFEDKKGKRYTSRPWRFTNTVDIIIRKKGIGIPKGTENWNFPLPRTGIAYAGIRIHPKYREFLQIKLLKKLKQGKFYLFEMFVQSSKNTGTLLKSIGMSIHIRKPSYTNKINFIIYPPQINYFDDNGIGGSIDDKEWIKIRGIYRARGGEKYLSIGDFSKTLFKKRLKIISLETLLKLKLYSYYFIDDISVVECDKKGVPTYMKKNKDSLNLVALDTISFDSLKLEQDSLFFKTPDSIKFDILKENYIYKIETERKLILNKIRFDFGKHKLLYRSFEELELLLEYLNTNPSIKLLISGHTDNIGNDKNNMILSEKRAKTVYKYLIENRISKDRISYIGKGETEPMSSNETDKGRSKNRRVEILIRE